MQLRNHSGKYATTILSLALGVFLLSLQAFAANHYVRAAASGAASGADWTNACTDFTGSCAVASLVRGDTYYVGTGAYAGRTFSTAASGSTLITIKGATVADHGAATGWSNTFSVSNADGGTQATFSIFPAFTTSHWIFDGAVGPLWDTTPADFGFKMTDGLDGGVVVGAFNSTGSDITVSHITALADSANNEKLFLQTANQTNEWDSITVSHSLMNGWQNCMMIRGNPGVTDVGWVLEYNTILNIYSNVTNNHGECMNPNSGGANGMIVRYNLIKGRSGAGDGLTGVIVANNSNNTNCWVYGNVIDNVLSGNGTITGTSSGNMNSCTVIYNTFLNIPHAGGNNIIGGTGQGTSNSAQNNVFYNEDGAIGAGWTTDWNSYFTVTNSPTETHKQTGSGDPFVNSAGGNYQLTTDTTAGNTLSNSLPTGCTVGVNCEDIDALGVQHGANGTNDRGALQIAGGNPQAASPSFSPGAGTYIGSQSVTITSSSGGAIICYNTTGSPVTNGTSGCTTGTLYSGPVTVSVNSTLFAVAGGTGFTDSTVASANYNFTVPPQNGVGSSLSAISH